MSRQPGSPKRKRGRCNFLHAAITGTCIILAIYAIVESFDGPASLTDQASRLKNGLQTALGQAPGDAAAIVAAVSPANRTCNPTPWLETYESLPYRGLENDLDALLRMQSAPLPDSSYRAISLVFFNHPQSITAQNCLYSLIKYGSVCNYLVIVWDEPTLDACAEMNLPCYNATRHVPGGPIGAAKEAELHTKDYNKITWMKPILVRLTLERGYVVHATDVDVAYFPADLMRSYYRFIKEAGADAAFQREVVNRLPTQYVVNTGNYMVLPTPHGISLMRAWVREAGASIAEGNHEQFALGRIYHRDEAFHVCQAPWACAAMARKRKEGQTKDRAIVRRTHNPWGGVFGQNCAPKDPGAFLYPAAPCHYPHMYFHAVCVIGGEKKTIALKAAGFWFMDDQKGCSVHKTKPHVTKCKPLAWRRPEAEADFEVCDRTKLAFRYFQGHEGVALHNTRRAEI